MSTDALPGFEHLAAPAEKQSRRSGPTADELLEGLNEPQRAAVVHEGTPLLVVAGVAKAIPAIRKLGRIDEPPGGV